MKAPLQSVAHYYTARVREHGATPRGVDWNGAEGQELRFATLLRILPPAGDPVSLDDYGCGYGALFDYLRAQGRGDVDYAGFDVSPEMIAEAKARHASDGGRFHLGEHSARRADFAVASGIFNVRPGVPAPEWEAHIATTLDQMNAGAARGFAFNCLTSYSDPPKRKEYLYYGDPCFYFDLCKRRYSRNVALLHDYGLYEFTLLVRKEP